MQHEGARDLARLLDGVETLRVLRGAECRGDERLRLAAREQRRAMRTRQHAIVDADRTHFVGLAAVDTPLGVEHLRPELVVFDVAEDGMDILGVVGELDQQPFGELLLGTLDRLDARVLVFLIQRFADAPRRELLHLGRDPFRRLRLRPRHLGLLHLGEQLVLHGDELTDAVV